MAKSAVESKPPAKKPTSKQKPSATNSEIVDVTAENGEHIEPPPPEAVEPDPELSPEEAEQARKDYLLTRFWISARGYWGSNGDRLAWPFTIGPLSLCVGGCDVARCMVSPCRTKPGHRIPEQQLARLLHFTEQGHT